MDAHLQLLEANGSSTMAGSFAHDPVDRRWAQSIATKPLKPFNFENLRRRNAPKQVQVQDSAAARKKVETKGNRFTVRQPGRLQELIYRDLDFEKDNVLRWENHGMAATGQIKLADGSITYEHKLRRSAPAPDNEDRTAFYGRQSRKGSQPFWGSIVQVQTRDPTQNVHINERGEMYGPDPGQHAAAVDPPWLSVAQKTAGVRGNAKGRRDWDTPDWADKQTQAGRGSSSRNTRGSQNNRRRMPPGSRSKSRSMAQEKHPLTRTPEPQGARTGERPVWPTALGGAQVMDGLGDPFWKACPASELYRPSGPLHRKPPSRVRNDAAKAAAQLRQDDEEALR